MTPADKNSLIAALNFLEAQHRSYALYGSRQLATEVAQLAKSRGCPPPECIIVTDANSESILTIPVCTPESADWPRIQEVLSLTGENIEEVRTRFTTHQRDHQIGILDPFRQSDPYRDFTFDQLSVISLNSLENASRIEKLRNCHQGRRAFVIGAGPSLRVEDLDRLKGEITFASNKIYLAFDRTDWRPTYYSVLDVLVAQNNRRMISSLSLPKIYPTDVWPVFKDDPTVTWINARYLFKNGVYCDSDTEFSDDLMKGIFGGWTILYTQLQLAYWMGIREVYLIGVDFSFQHSPATGEMSPQGAVLKQTSEQNHFDPRYRPEGERWTIPRLDLQELAFSRARDFFWSRGGRIYNASRSTKLELFPIVEFDEVLNAPPPARPPLATPKACEATSGAPRVSVIIPVHNGARFIREALESVRAQSFSAWEAFVIDDGSTDNSAEIVSDFLTDPRFKMLQHEGSICKGVAASRALGIAHAAGDYIALLDADDLMRADRLSAQVQTLDDLPQAVLCHSGARFIYEDGQCDRGRERFFNFSESKLVYRLWEKDECLDYNRVCNSSVMIRKALLQDSFMPRRQAFQYEDWVLCLLLGREGDFVFLPEQLVGYRFHNNSSTARLDRNNLLAFHSTIEAYLTAFHRISDHGARRKIFARLIRTIELLSNAHIPESAAP